MVSTAAPRSLPVRSCDNAVIRRRWQRNPRERQRARGLARRMACAVYAYWGSIPHY